MKRSSTPSKRNRNRRKQYRGRKKHIKPVEDPKPALNVRVQRIRESVWKCMGVASCIEYASDSMLQPTMIKPDIQGAAEALFDMLSELGEPLEDVLKDVGGYVTAADDE